MVIGMYEFLDKVNKLKTAEEKINAIRHNDSIQLRIILQGAFDPNVIWMLPSGNPPYRPNEIVDQQHVLLKECEKIRYFIKGFHDSLNQTKRETMFVQFLERLDPQDAKLILAIKEKKLPFSGIHAGHVKVALPGLLPDNLEVPEITETPEPEVEVEVEVKKTSAPVSKPKKVIANSTKGKKWYHSSEEKLENLFEEGKQPKNWSRGRLPKVNE